MIIYVCTNCGLDDFTMHGVMNHEYGHALGLGHTSSSPCVMQSPLVTKYQCVHDRDAMIQTYASHYEG